MVNKFEKVKPCTGIMARKLNLSQYIINSYKLVIYISLLKV